MKLYYRMLKHDPDGSLVKDTGMLPSGSYVIQFLELIHGLFDGLTVNATDVGEVERMLLFTTGAIPNYGSMKALALDDTYGVVVGTNDGVTAEDNENFKLDTKIAHGAIGAAGTMNYRDVIFVAPRVVGPNVDFDVARPFVNETDATITVKEIGLICKNHLNSYYHLLLRDVVTDEDVEADYTLTVVYTLRTTA